MKIKIIELLQYGAQYREDIKSILKLDVHESTLSGALGSLIRAGLVIKNKDDKSYSITKLARSIINLGKIKEQCK